MSRPLLIISLFVTILSGSVFAKTSPRPVAIFHLEPHPGGTYMMTMRAKVRGHEGTFVFDTGGGVSYLSPSFAQTIGCKPWGQLSGFVLTGQRLDMKRCDNLMFYVDQHPFPAPITGVFDLMKFMPADVPKIDGSIGLDIFAAHAITLNLAERTLTVESAPSLKARIIAGREVPIRLVREVEGVALAVVVGVITPDGTAWMEIDSGNGGANVIAGHIAHLLNLKTGVKEPQPASFRLAGGIPVDGEARVNESLIMDGNIGTLFLIKWNLTLDLVRGRAWLSPAKSATTGSNAPAK